MNVPGGTTPAEPKVIDMDVEVDVRMLGAEAHDEPIESGSKFECRRYTACNDGAASPNRLTDEASIL